MATRTIVFIHGLWMHASSWQPWMDFFQQHGYTTMNPGWPGESETVAESRANPGPLAYHGVNDITDSYADLFANFPEPPIVIGHSFGGLIAQILLSEGDVAAAIALDPAPIKGVWQLPLSSMRTLFPVLANPFNLKKAVSLSFNQFKYAFANTITGEEARDIYERLTIPAPARPLFQAANAYFAGAATRVGTQNTGRGPLLITAGEKDHLVPPSLCRETVRKYNKSVITELKMFENRGHSLASDHGWKEIAEYCLEWLQVQGY